MKKIHFFFPAVLAGASFLTFGVANADDIFVSNNGNNSILEIPGGTSGPVIHIATTTNLAGPTGVAFNSAGDLFVANNGPFGGGFVAEYSGTNYMGTVASSLNNPRGLAFDSAGDLYVANQSSGVITEVPFNGTSYGMAFTLASGFNFPNGLAYQNGNLFVANAGTGSIVEVSVPGAADINPAFVTGLFNPNGLAFLGSALLVVNTGMNQVLAFTSTGAPDNIFGGTNIFTSTHLDNAHGIAVDSSNNVWVTDEGNGTVVEFSSTGVYKSTFSGFSGPNFVTTEAVPEPSTYVLMLGGLGALFFLARRKKATL